MNLPYETDLTNRQLSPWLLLRLERAVSHLAAQRGYHGDLLADPVPQPVTLGDLYAAGGLWLDLPADLRQADPGLAKRLCQAAVFGSSGEPEWPTRSAVQSPALTRDKLARERRRTRAERAAR